VTTFVLELDRPDRANALSADLVERLHAGLDRAIAAVTLEQANAAFRKYVDPAKLATVYAGDWTKTPK